MKVEKYRVLGELIETNKRQFVIPVYQRNYDWRKDNCKTLFDDIVNAVVMDRLHFVGSIVYVDQGEENKIYRYLMAVHFSGRLHVLGCSMLSTLVNIC